MSWMISQALMKDYENSHYLQELAAESLEGNCLDGALSAQSNTTNMPQAYCSQDKMTDCSRLSRFGMTFAPFPACLGKELLTWFLADFHVKTSAQQEKAQELTASEADSGQKWQGSFAKYNPDSRSWKTAQRSLLADSDEFSETWPRWGTMRNGECWEQTTLAHHTIASESGYWATPTTMDKLPPKSPEALEREAVVARPGRSKPANLRDQVSNMQSWPTPTVSGNYNKKGSSKTSGNGLATEVNMFPTPQASDNRDRGNLSSGAVLRRMEKGKQISLSQSVSKENGRLNPEWVELLMGWPRDWTSLVATGIDIHQWMDGFTSGLSDQQERWLNGSWEVGTARTSDGLAARSDRLKAIGNGQVPICAAVAFRLLASRFEDR